MTDKRKFWILIGLLIISLVWLFVARHYASSSFLEQLQNT